jgi:hypothetical protein
MFTIVVIGIAIGVFTMYFRHDRQMRRKRLAETAAEPRPGSPPADPGRRDPP